MIQAVLRTICRHNMLPPGSRLIAGVSGGPDSVCLLHVLEEVAPQLGITVTGIAHVNHKLRGGESDADEQFVARLAESKALRFFPHSRPGLRPDTAPTPPNTPRPAPPPNGFVSSKNLEQSLRRIRRDFFTSLIRQGAATHVALGHNRDDQAETVLFRLLRGSGLTGLAGILPVAQNGFVQPLLEVSRADVRAYLTARGIPWREDSSNRDPRYSRNRIRHALLPQLASEWNPRLSENLAHLADLAYQEELWWAAEIERAASRMFVQSTESLEARGEELAALPEAYLRRLLRYAVRKVKGDLRRVEFQHIEDLLTLVRGYTGRSRLDIPAVRAERSLDWVRVGRASGCGRLQPALDAPQPVKIGGRYPAPDGKTMISLELTQPPTPALPCDTLKLDLVSAKLPETLKLRGWRQGDRYRPLGQSRERKLKEMFQESRVPSWRRLGWPILCIGERIVWARRFGAAAEFAASPAVGERSTRQMVLIRESPLSGERQDGS